MALEFEDSALEIHRWSVGPYDNNVYVLRCKSTGSSLLVDAANEAEVLLDACRTLDVRQIVETHGHSDHIQAIPVLRDAGYEVGVAAADAAMLPSYDLILNDDELLEVGDLRVRTILTPGHTPGSMCYSVEGFPLLFSGDTLFPGGPGGTKGKNGDFDTIIESIDTRLFSVFGPETMVLPGHGRGTTIGDERPHLQEWIDRGW